MNIKNLGSSSAGNAYIIELQPNPADPDTKRTILLEAGFPGHELHQRIVRAGCDLNEIDAVLISHHHMDHAAAAIELRRRGKRVYGNSLVCSGPDALIEANHLKAIAPDVYVYPFPVEHDAPDTFGYLIRCGGESLLFATDCAFIPLDLSRFQPTHVMLEANYDGRTMHFALEGAKDDPAKYEQLRRITQTHMSIKHTIETLKKMDLSKCLAIFLIHLSDRHSRALDFENSVHEATGKPVVICQKNGGTFSRTTPTRR